MTKKDKDIRLQVRCSAEEKEMFARAARFTGFRTTSEFVRVTVHKFIRNMNAHWVGGEEDEKQHKNAL